MYDQTELFRTVWEVVRPLPQGRSGRSWWSSQAAEGPNPLHWKLPPPCGIFMVPQSMKLRIGEPVLKRLVQTYKSTSPSLKPPRAVPWWCSVAKASALSTLQTGFISQPGKRSSQVFLALGPKGACSVVQLAQSV